MKEWILMIGKFGLAVSGVLWLLAACNDDREAGIQYHLDITVSAPDVVKDLKDDLYFADIFPGGSLGSANYKVRISIFLYGEDGTLFDDETKYVDDFATDVKITIPVPAGKYTAVATADIVESNGSQANPMFWQIEDISLLENLKITSLHRSGTHGVLGIGKSVVTINKVETLTLALKPAGSLIQYRFWSAHVEQISTIILEYDKESDFYHASDGVSKLLVSSASREEGGIRWMHSISVESGYTGYIIAYYTLPMQNQALTWTTLDMAGNIVKTGRVSFDVQAGVNPLIEIDAVDGETNISNL
jgi:hypothetical protein